MVADLFEAVGSFDSPNLSLWPLANGGHTAPGTNRQVERGEEVDTEAVQEGLGCILLHCGIVEIIQDHNAGITDQLLVIQRISYFKFKYQLNNQEYHLHSHVAYTPDHEGVSWANVH